MTNTAIVPVGLTQTGAIGAPATANQVGWYDGSAKPGAPTGAMFIDGHFEASLKGGGAVFSDLDRLAVGDPIRVVRGDGASYAFTVVKTAVVPLSSVDMDVMLTSAVQGKLGLNLMTCGGTYDGKTETFDHRVEVYAVET